MRINIEAPLAATESAKLRCGDTVYISGKIYAARDEAHKRLVALIREGTPLPFPVEDAVIYYVGPTPAKPGSAIGSAGPTTSSRMDAYAPELLRLGLRGMIGKGRRSREVTEAIVSAGAVYFGAIGGAGALLSKCIKSAEVIAYEDLGPEALRLLEVEDFPAVVVIDSLGNCLYDSGRRSYLESRVDDTDV